MDRNDGTDPFAGLEDWAKDTERRVGRESRRQGGLRGLRRVVVILGGVAIAVLVLAVAVPAVRSWLPSGGGKPAAYPRQSVPSGVSATSSESAAATDPFAGTPAAAYPKGLAGITLPRAKAVAGFSAAQVGAALQQVRKALVAGRLDEAMLVEHRPTGLLDLLAPNSRDGIVKWFQNTDFQSVATWIDPAVRLNPGEKPRVSGRVTYSSAQVDGRRTLQVTTNFIWVYAFEGADRPIAAEHDEIRWDFPTTKNLRPGDWGMWVGAAKSYAAWVDCAASNKGLLAPTRHTGVAPAPSDTEDPANYLKADHAIEIGDDCGNPSPSPSH